MTSVSQVDAVERLLRAADDGTLAAACTRHAVTILTLFGSARTDPSSADDVDLAVQVGRTDGDVGALVVDLMELAGTDAALEFYETDWLRRLDLQLMAE